MMKKLFTCIICCMIILNCGFASFAASAVDKTTNPTESINKSTEPVTRAVTPPLTSLVIDDWGKMMDPYISGREVYYVRVTKMGSSRWISGTFNGNEVRTIAIESIRGSGNIVIGNKYYYEVGNVGQLAPGTYNFKTQAMCNVTSRMFEVSRNIPIK